MSFTRTITFTTYITTEREYDGIFTVIRSSAIISRSTHTKTSTHTEASFDAISTHLIESTTIASPDSVKDTTISSSDSVTLVSSPLRTQITPNYAMPPQSSISADNFTLVGNNGDDLSAGAEAAIALGVILFVLLVIGGIFLIRRIRRPGSAQLDMAVLNLGEVITDPNPKPKSKMKKLKISAFFSHGGTSGANQSLIGLGQDKAGSQLQPSIGGTAQEVGTITQKRLALNDLKTIQTNYRSVDEEGLRRTTFSSQPQEPSTIFAPTPIESHSPHLQKLANSEDIAQLENEAKRIDEQIVDAERLQQLRNERLIIQNRLREARRASLGSSSQTQM